jgi:acyl phosphate:glycerol-3-phosphate acyltransferase
MSDSIFGLILCVPVAYMLGSVPTAVWTGKWFFGLDVREHGSGNAGATNAYRVLGPVAAIGVLLVDALKGMAAVSLAFLVRDYFSHPDYFVVFQFVLGLIALLGHVFPVLAGFKGGKGVATLAGVMIVMFPGVVLICLGIFLLVFLPTRFVSLGSIAAALSFPVIVIWIQPAALLSEIIFSSLIALLVLLTHIKNIRRLLAGEESRIRFRK